MSSDAIDLIEVFAKTFEGSSEEVNMDSDFESIAAWDSLGHLSLIKDLENTTRNTFTAREVARMSSIRDIVKVLGQYGYSSGEGDNGLLLRKTN